MPLLSLLFSSFFYALRSPDRPPRHVATPRQRNIRHEHHETRSTDEYTKLGPENGVGLHLIAVARVGVATSFRSLATTVAIARDYASLAAYHVTGPKGDCRRTAHACPHTTDKLPCACKDGPLFPGVVERLRYNQKSIVQMYSEYIL